MEKLIEDDKERREMNTPKRVIIRVLSGELQYVKLIMQVGVRLPSGRRENLRVLIDTGAEVNLIREGLIPYHEFTEARKKLFFTMANGQPMRGGDSVLNGTLMFKKSFGREGPQRDFSMDAQFYEADIHVDAILGNPWLIKEGLATYPVYRALTRLDDMERWHCYWSDTSERKTKRGGKKRKQIYEVDISQDGSGRQPEWLEKLGVDICGEEWRLNREEIEQVKRRISVLEGKAIRSVIVGNSGGDVEDPRVEGLRAKVHEDYDGVDLCKEVIPNPPVRGDNGYATIPLKEGAVPKRQIPFQQFGEKMKP